MILEYRFDSKNFDINCGLTAADYYLDLLFNKCVDICISKNVQLQVIEAGCGENDQGGGYHWEVYEYTQNKLTENISVLVGANYDGTNISLTIDIDNNDIKRQMSEFIHNTIDKDTK